MNVLFKMLKSGGKLILSDFHPISKILDTLFDVTGVVKDEDYFSTEIAEGEMAHVKYYDEEERKRFPKCLYRRYTLSEIINTVLKTGFVLTGFDEHPSWVNAKLPGEYTLLAVK